jgi:preprotein translocase subunit YajC
MSPEALQQILFFGLVALVFYFFMLRPQQQRTAEQKKLRDNLTRGQQVITAGGLHGRITDITDTTVTIEVDKNVRLTFEKASITQVPGETASTK